MKTFEFVMTDEVGIHARPAGLLVKEAKKYKSRIFIQKGDVKAEAVRLIAMMGMGVKCGDTLTVTVEGPDEDAAAENIKSFMEKNF